MANADDSNRLAIELVLGFNMTVFDEPDYGLEGVWHTSHVSTSTFDIVVTNTGFALDDDLNVFLSTTLDVVDYEGSDWDCWDVDGGVQCLNQDTTVHDEAWPALHITTHLPSGEWEPYDTLDVYADSSVGDAHAGVPLWGPVPE
ncbi:MAG: hypothetical protein ABWY11_07420 [Umezawaea sp.]